MYIFFVGEEFDENDVNVDHTGRYKGIVKSKKEK